MRTNREPTKEELAFVRSSLTAFNDKAVGQDGHTPLCFTEQNDDGEIIAGLIGGTYWGWMYVDILWVEEKYRFCGIGSQLLSDAEEEARHRGCHHVHLETMSWQAPEFYKKHGYTVLGVLPDIPEGHEKYILTKAL